MYGSSIEHWQHPPLALRGERRSQRAAAPARPKQSCVCSHEMHKDDERLMAIFHRANTTIFSCDDFVLWTASTDHATQIMQITDIDIAGVKIVVYPWTPTFNCTTISIDNLPLHDHSIAPVKRPRDEICEHLKITVYGVPPHLTKAQTIPRVFPNICQPSNMHIDKENIIYSFKTYACRADIPSTWNLGIRRGTMLHLWPIWIDVKSCAPPTQVSRARQDVSNVRVRFSLFPTPSVGPSGHGDGDGHQGGYFVESRDDSSEDSYCTAPVTPDYDPFELPLSLVPSFSQITEVPETQEDNVD